MILNLFIPLFLVMIFLQESVSPASQNPPHRHDDDENWTPSSITTGVSNSPADSDGLSAWHLYLINDLMFQIAMKKCPKISRPDAGFLNDFISEALKQAPTNHNQDPDAVPPEYSNLLNCFEYLDTTSSNPGKKLEKNVTIEKPEGPKKNERFFSHASMDNQGKWHIFYWADKIYEMIAGLFRGKRSTDADKKSDESESNPEIIKNDKQARLKFSGFLRDINHISRVACPQKFKPSKRYLKMLRKQILHWVSKDTHSLTSVVIKYFNKKDNDNILKQIDECLDHLNE